jgi:hypothetical protein
MAMVTTSDGITLLLRQLNEEWQFRYFIAAGIHFHHLLQRGHS